MRQRVSDVRQNNIKTLKILFLFKKNSENFLLSTRTVTPGQKMLHSVVMKIYSPEIDLEV